MMAWNDAYGAPAGGWAKTLSSASGVTSRRPNLASALGNVSQPLQSEPLGCDGSGFAQPSTRTLSGSLGAATNTYLYNASDKYAPEWPYGPAEVDFHFSPYGDPTTSLPTASAASPPQSLPISSASVASPVPDRVPLYMPGSDVDCALYSPEAHEVMRHFIKFLEAAIELSRSDKGKTYLTLLGMRYGHEDLQTTLQKARYKHREMKNVAKELKRSDAPSNPTAYSGAAYRPSTSSPASPPHLQHGNNGPSSTTSSSSSSSTSSLTHPTTLPPPPPPYAEACALGTTALSGLSPASSCASSSAPHLRYGRGPSAADLDFRPSLDALDFDQGVLSNMQQSVMLAAVGCSGLPYEVAALCPVTPRTAATACPVLRDPNQEQLLQCRYGGPVTYYLPKRALASPAASASASGTSASSSASSASASDASLTFSDAPTSSTASSSTSTASSSSASSAPSPAASFCPHGFVVKVVPYASEGQRERMQRDGYDTSGVRPLEEAAREAANAGGLHAASLALSGERGPYLAPLYVKAARLYLAAQAPGAEGCDCELVMVFPYCPDGDGHTYLERQLGGVFDRAEERAADAEGAEAVAARCEHRVWLVAHGMAEQLGRLHELGAITGDHKLGNYLPYVPCPGGDSGPRFGQLIDSESVALCPADTVLAGSGVHTPCFAAPEQLEDGWRGRCSDVWALGSAVRAMLGRAAQVAEARGWGQVAERLGNPPEGSRFARLLAACLADSPAHRMSMDEARRILSEE